MTQGKKTERRRGGRRKGIDVRVIRRRAKLTQEEFAKALGTHKRSVQFWEVDKMDEYISKAAEEKIDTWLKSEGKH